jgi:hypothetical protein
MRIAWVTWAAVNYFTVSRVGILYQFKPMSGALHVSDFIFSALDTSDFFNAFGISG